MLPLCQLLQFAALICVFISVLLWVRSELLKCISIMATQDASVYIVEWSQSKQAGLILDEIELD